MLTHTVHWLSVPQLVCYHMVSGVPQIVLINCIFICYSKKRNKKTSSFVTGNKKTHRGSPSTVFSRMYYVLFPQVCTLTEHGFTCRYILTPCTLSYSHFMKQKFCGVPPSVFNKSGWAMGEKRLLNTALTIPDDYYHLTKFLLLHSSSNSFTL
jgi:hypothetical protein